MHCCVSPVWLFEDSYEEVFEDFEANRSSGEDISDRVERPMGNRASQFSRLEYQLKLKHTMEVSNFSSTLNLEDLTDWIGELEDYFELEDIEDPLRVRFTQTKLKGHVSLWWNKLQRDREEEGEMKITRYRLMVSNLKAKFIPTDYEFELALMESDMIAEIVSALGGVPWHVGTEDGYEEATKDFEVARLSGGDIHNY